MKTSMFSLLLAILVVLGPGLQTHASEFPFMASIKFGMQGQYLHCTGAIINETHVVTLATCLLKLPLEASVFVGSYHFNQVNSRPVDIDHVIFHPAYWPENLFWPTEHGLGKGGDIGLVILKEALEWKPNVQPAPIRRVPLSLSQCSCQLLTFRLRKPTDTQLSVEVIPIALLQQSDCFALGIRNLPRDQICGFDSALDVTPKKDYGAPIVCDGNLIGLLAGPQKKREPFAIIPLAGHFRFIYDSKHEFE